jgi:DNA-binding SARP family transcriptional activator/tetratricopeptide (TPR) repeat protein
VPGIDKASGTSARTIALMSRLVIRLFGSPRFVFDGESWRFAAPPRTLPLLAYLVLRARPVPRSAVAAALWPDELDADARANLRRHLSRLRAALPAVEGTNWILEREGSIAWNDAAPAEVDVAAFMRCAGDPGTRAEALAWCDGDLLESAPADDEWLIVERERLRSVYHDVLLDAAAGANRARDFAQAIVYAERLLHGDEWREDALRHLMAARYESGDRSGALAEYGRFAERLEHELRTAPMLETTALRERIAAGLPLVDLGARPFETEHDAAGGTGAFVGRRNELDRLRGVWTRAARGFGGALFIAGEAGIGKSRLAAEFTTLVERQGGRALVGATAQPESAPYQALIGAAQRGLAAFPSDRLADVWLRVLAHALPEIRAIRPDLGEGEELDPVRARIRLHEAIARLFETIARARPLVLVLEDLHWAGGDTIDALEMLARHASGAPLLLVATYRPEEAGPAHPLRAAMRRLQAERRATRITPGALSEIEIAELVASTPALAAAPPRLTLAVAELSEGNPLFAWQLLRGYVETSEIPDRDGAVRGVSDAILARVERLSTDVRAVADVAATVGRDFTIELVAHAGGWTESVVARAIDELVVRHLVRESAGTGASAFAHALIATTIYAHTAPALRAQRHRRIARALEQTGEGDLGALGSIARHWELAGEREQGGAAYLRAAQAAFAVYAHDEAVRYARRAAELTDDVQTRYAALHLAVSAAQFADAGVDTLREDLERLEAVVAELGDAERFAMLEAWESYYGSLGKRDLQALTIEAMFALAERSGDARERVIALDSRGFMALNRGLISEADPVLREALHLAEAGTDRELLARVRMRVISMLIRKGDVEAALVELDTQRRELGPDATLRDRLRLHAAEASCAQMLENAEMCRRVGEAFLDVAQRACDVDAEAKAHALLAYAAHQRGEASAMRAHDDRAIALFEQLGRPHPLCVTLGNRGVFEREIGQIDDALAFWDRAGSIGDAIGHRDSVATRLINRAEAEFVRRHLAQADALARRALEVSIETGEERLVAEALVLLGAVECARGEVAGGIVRMREGIARRVATEGIRSLADDLCYLVEALLAAQARDEAQIAAAELEAIAFPLSVAKYPARVCLVLGLAARTAGDSATAERHLAEGRRILQARLALLEPRDAQAHRELPFNRRLLEPESDRHDREAEPSRGTSTAPRNR